MHRGLVLFAAAGFLISPILAPTSRAAQAPPSRQPRSAAAVTPEQVEAAIRKGVQYLYSQRKGDNWETASAPQINPKGGDHTSVKAWQWGGISAVALCSLLYAGESPRQLKDSIEWLKNAEIYGIYAMGFRCQIWAMLPDPASVRRIAMRDRDYLLAAAHPPGPNVGMYPYYFFRGKYGGGRENWYDHSVSQYGVLGMWAISQLNVEIPPQYWRAVEMTWKAHQQSTGGWGYRFQDDNNDWTKETLSMTAAGLATLYITQETAHAMDGLDCRGNYVDEHVERATQWVHANFANFRKAHTYYTLYGIERVGVAGGHKYFGNLNWYEVGAAYLVEKQHKDGSWGEPSDNYNPRKIPDTAFALMFLCRGRAPVMMNKLEYVFELPNNRTRPGSWNERPRDVANIVRWTGRQIERDLNWQIVNLRAPIDELHDAPILWISGKESLDFAVADLAKLREFVEGGGLIVGNADCGSRNFAESFRKLGQKLFPMYEFRELPESHVIYSNQQFKRKTWRNPPFLQGLSNGVRELMLLFPMVDPARGYQTQSFMGPDREAMSQVMANIFLYAVDKKNLRYKGESFLVNADPKATATRSIKVARLQYGGNWDPEPAGWRRLASIMHNRHQTDLAVQTVKLGTGALGRAYTVAHLTGTNKFKLDPQQQAEIQKFVAGGGTLVVDAAGGSTEFNLAAESELIAMFPAARGFATPLRSDHSVFSTGETITTFDYRTYLKKTLGNVRTPRLRGFEQAGKVRVFFSSEDLSAGLVGQSVDGVFGYEPRTASAIMANILLYAAAK